MADNLSIWESAVGGGTSAFEASLGYLWSDMSVRLGYSISNFPFQIKYIKIGILQNLMYGIRVLP